MFAYIFDKLSCCFTQLVHHTTTARHRLIEGVFKAVYKGLAIVGADSPSQDQDAVNISARPLSIPVIFTIPPVPPPPPPSKTYPIWLEPTRALSTGVHYRPKAFWICTLVMIFVSLLLVARTLSRLSIRPAVTLFNTPWGIVKNMLVELTPAIKEARNIFQVAAARLARIVKNTVADFVLAISNVYAMARPYLASGMLRVSFRDFIFKLPWRDKPAAEPPGQQDALIAAPAATLVTESFLTTKLDHDLGPKLPHTAAPSVSEFQSLTHASRRHPSQAFVPSAPEQDRCAASPPQPRQRPHATETEGPISRAKTSSELNTTDAEDEGVWGSAHWTVFNFQEFKTRIDPGQFKLKQKLGQGGFGDVVEITSGRRTLALKRVAKGAENVRERNYIQFCAEAIVPVLMEEVGNSTFPKFYGAFESRDHWYLAMERGEASLGNLKGDLRRDLAMKFSRELVAGVHALHRECVAHLDIKPDNLLLRSDCSLMIIDFGLAKVFPTAELDGGQWREWHELRVSGNDRFPMLWAGKANPHSVQGSFGGTKNFMSPLVAYRKPFSYGADLWAVGVTMHRWLKGRRPHWFFEWERFIPVRPDLENDSYSSEELDFFTRIFSCEEPLRFESWKEIKEHAIWQT